MYIKSRLENLWLEIKRWFQRKTRKHGCADSDIWGLYSHLAEVIYPKLKAFKKAYKHGYPCVFSEYEDDLKNHMTKEEYDEAGYIGGGSEAWEKVIDEMIFAFEFVLMDEDKLSRHQASLFKKKYGDWHEKKPENLHQHVWYKDPEDPEHVIMLSANEEPKPNWVKLEKGFLSEPYYFDTKLHIEHSKRAAKGFELFGKYFMNLWD